MNKFIILEKINEDNFDIHFSEDMDQTVAIVDSIVTEKLNKTLNEVNKEKLDQVVEVYSSINNKKVKKNYFM